MREPAYCSLMRLYASVNELSASIQTYDGLEIARLQAGLDGPSAETRGLFSAHASAHAASRAAPTAVAGFA